ncbi:MAG: hypothetical protein H0W83_08815 [Planctomycetes bacterium]|nr:hypothetical protein [Planctomycetota bacterium]
MGSCPCDDGDPDFPAPSANYALADVLSDTPYPPPPTGTSAQIRRCARCDAVWWVRVHVYEQVDTDRDGEPTGTTRRRIDDNGLRCRDLTEAKALIPWYPLMRDAERRFERILPEPGVDVSPEMTAAVIAAHADFATLLARHPQAGQLLAQPHRAAGYLSWQPSALVIRTVIRRITTLIEQIVDGDASEATRNELTSLQARCAAARAADPHMDHDSVSLAELWTGDLAVVPALDVELGHLTSACHAGTLDARAAERLHAVRRALASAWHAFHRHVRWPSPEVEFRLLLEYLCRLDPVTAPASPDAWDEPERVAFRLRALMQQHDLLPAREVVILPWMAKLLDIPQTSRDPRRPFWRPPRPVRWSQRR